jgi:hypothetical protein
MGNKSTADKQGDNRGRDAKGRFTSESPTAFKPGQSGNPSGRPKSITLSEALKLELAKLYPEDETKTNAERVAEVLVAQAAQGNIIAAKEVADRTEGRPRQAVDVDMSVLDWRAVARAHGVSEQDVIAEAKRIISESLAAGGSPAGH